MGPKIRRLGIGDAAAFAELDADMFGNDAWPRAMITAYLDSDRIYAIGIDGEDGLDAGAMLGRGIEAEILTISVRPHLRRQGIGSALLGRMLTHATETGAEKVFLEVRASDDGAQALYARHGFVEVGRRPKYYHDDDGIIMVRD